MDVVGHDGHGQQQPTAVDRGLQELCEQRLGLSAVNTIGGDLSRRWADSYSRGLGCAGGVCVALWLVISPESLNVQPT